MARKRKKKRTRRFSQEVALILTGSALTLCALSVMYGFLIRNSVAGEMRYRIEVLNGTGQAGLAQRLAESARRKGIDVFQVANADSFSYAECILIGRKDGVDIDAFGRALGVHNVIEQLDAESFVDATLIIGADYHTLNLEDSSRLLE